VLGVVFTPDFSHLLYPFQLYIICIHPASYTIRNTKGTLQSKPLSPWRREVCSWCWL